MVDFVNVLKAWLHDPPSKALGVRGHVARSRALLADLLGGETREATEFGETEAEAADRHSKEADISAAVSERLPLPSAGRDGERAVGPEDGLLAYHPLSGQEHRVETAKLRVDDELAALREIAEALGPMRDNTRALFLALWRMLPEQLGRRHPDWRILPADTRQPDHSIWNHMDLAAAFAATGTDAALLSFSIGPVQSFIASARTARDLWSGSLLLSHLTFAAMRPILEKLGPQCFVYPACRGIPAVDAWLAEEVGLPRKVLKLPDAASRLVPAIPNRFLVLVPRSAERQGEACAQAARDEWARVASAVHRELKRHWGEVEGWDRLWHHQVSEYFDVRVSCLDRLALAPLREQLLGEAFFAAAKALNALAEAIPVGDRRYAHIPPTWAADVALSAKLAEARREVSRFAPPVPAGMVPPKCTMLGDLEVMGPAEMEASRRFWESAADPSSGLSIHGFRVRRHERLSAVALVKRFWIPACLARDWSFEPAKTRIADTATVAARPWLRQAGIDVEEVRSKFANWSGQWVFESEETSAADEEDPAEPEECPPRVRDRLREARKELGTEPLRYYGVLHLDGDRLGDWLRGELLPEAGKLLHPKLRSYFENLSRGEGAKVVRRALQTRRVLGPASHAALSEALLNFSVWGVPALIHEAQGDLIYAGGDDVLALLPLEMALQCARSLQELYRQEADSQGRVLMGSAATVSAGLAVTHHRASLRSAIEAARGAERAAKAAGRDALGLTVLRRSGEHVTVVVPWLLAPDLERLTGLFRGGLTDRWVYHLRREAHSLGTDEVFLLELKRLLGRAELPGAEGERLRELVLRLAPAFLKELRDRLAANTPDEKTDLREAFCVLVQSAAFLARGRDER